MKELIDFAKYIVNVYETDGMEGMYAREWEVYYYARSIIENNTTN